RGLDRGRLVARPAELPELPRRHLGAFLRRRADPAGRPLVATALTDTSIAAVERALNEERPANGQRTRGRTPRVWAPGARLAGAGGVAGGRREDARRHGRAPPLADGDPHARAAPQGRARRARERGDARHGGLGQGRLVGGGRAAPERWAREGAGLDRAAVADQ